MKIKLFNTQEKNKGHIEMRAMIIFLFLSMNLFAQENQVEIIKKQLNLLNQETKSNQVPIFGGLINYYLNDIIGNQQYYRDYIDFKDLLKLPTNEQSITLKDYYFTIFNYSFNCASNIEKGVEVILENNIESIKSIFTNKEVQSSLVDMAFSVVLDPKGYFIKNAFMEINHLMNTLDLIQNFIFNYLNIEDLKLKNQMMCFAYGVVSTEIALLVLPLKIPSPGSILGKMNKKITPTLIQKEIEIVFKPIISSKLDMLSSFFSRESKTTKRTIYKSSKDEIDHRGATYSNEGSNPYLSEQVVEFGNINGEPYSSKALSLNVDALNLRIFSECFGDLKIAGRVVDLSFDGADFMRSLQRYLSREGRLINTASRMAKGREVLKITNILGESKYLVLYAQTECNLPNFRFIIFDNMSDAINYADHYPVYIY